MYGRYGVDQLGNFLFISYIILFVISLFVPYAGFLCYALIIYSLLECSLNKSINDRQKMNGSYQKQLGLENSLIVKKTNGNIVKHINILKCPHCHQYLRVPKGKGNITITCPTCHQQFDKRT